MLVLLLLSVLVRLSLSQTTSSLSAQCSYTFYVPKSTAIGNQCEGTGTDGAMEDLKEENKRLATLYTEIQSKYPTWRFNSRLSFNNYWRTTVNSGKQIHQALTARVRCPFDCNNNPAQCCIQ